MSFLISHQNENFFFQKVSQTTYLKRKKLIHFGEAAQIEQDRTWLCINPFYPDAIYVSSEHKLIFRDLSRLTQIFKGIDILYKEATFTEVSNFLQLDFIKIDGAFDINKVSKANRKRITLAQALLEHLTNDHSRILTHLKEYENENEKLNYDEEAHQFIIRNDEELKILLYGISERFHTTPFTNEKRIANSIQTLTG